MNGSILVTGASGFVGRHLVPALRNRGELVLTQCSRDGNIAYADFRLDGVRHVYHLAARTFVPDSWNDPRGFYEVNVLGTANIAEFCRKSGASLTLLSSYVYGKPECLPIPENHPLRPFNPYGHSKILAEEVASFYRESFGVPVTIVRAFNIYGPLQPRRFLIPTLIAQALSPDCKAVIIADERPKRDYVFIEDIVTLLLKQLDYSAPGSIYNGGSGSSISVQNLAEKIVRLTGTHKPVLSRSEERQDEVMDTVADITRAARELSWFPAVGLEEGLRRTIDFAIKSGASLSSAKQERT